MKSELCVVDWAEQGSVYVWVQAHSFSRLARVREGGREGIVTCSVRKGNDLILDYDAEGYLFGIEILNVPERLSAKASPVGVTMAPQPPEQTTPMPQ